jgi:hypothetical protein
VAAVIFDRKNTIMSTASSNSVESNREAVPSVFDLVFGDVPQLLAWMASEHCNTDKLDNVLGVAAIVGRTDICLVIADNERTPISHLGWILSTACYHNCLTLAKTVFERYRSSFAFQYLQHALHQASSRGHSEVVQWLLGEMKLSHHVKVIVLLVTTSARGDIDTVKMLTAQTASQAIHDTSHALASACYNGRFDVVNWLMANTASNVRKDRNLNIYNAGTMMSLSAASYNGHADGVRI